jgi:endoglucanase
MDGTILGEINGQKNGPTVMLTAHVDEIGFMVRLIDDDGFIHFDAVGGAAMNTMMARRVIINGKNGRVNGISGLKPGHVQTPDEAAKVPKVTDCFIDVGAVSKDEVLKMGIDVGTTGVYDSPVSSLKNGDILSGRAIDNRTCVAYLLELAEELTQAEFSGKAVICLSTLEETGCLGAAFASKVVNPDYAIAVDTVPAGGTPGVDYKRLPINIGGGPVITYSDGGSVRNFHNRKLLAFAENGAEKLNIPLQKTSLMGISVATDTMGIGRFGTHCPCISITTPRRYSHSPVEMLNLNDAMSAYELVKYFVLNNDKVNLEYLD